MTLPEGRRSVCLSVRQLYVTVLYVCLWVKEVVPASDEVENVEPCSRSAGCVHQCFEAVLSSIEL